MQSFRGDIQGLRAVAVIPILLFHAGVEILRGGYTGVDVFFVISGFLITQIILGDIEKQKFSILKFYQRRVARILPALFFVLLASGLAAGFVLQIPSEISSFFLSLAAASAFASNIYFFQEINYFAGGAESEALLHTWSLGVEEQFYIFFPIFLFALRNVGRKTLKAALIGVSLVSLVAGTIVQQFDPLMDFYMLPFRTWELLIGSLIAIGVQPKLGPKLSTLAALTGAAMIAASAFLLVNWLPFPSPFALVPCIGTALVIAYGQNTVIGRVLSAKPFQWIGMISFSLYLWHWPIITFYRQTTGDHLDLVETGGLLAASVFAAAVSYYLVENPARDRLRSLPTKTAVIIGGVSALAVSGVALLVANNAGKIWNVDPRVEQIASYQNYKEWTTYPEQVAVAGCFIANASEALDEEFCLTLRPDARNVLILGDSHAEMYSVALRRKFPEINWLQATHFGCPPVRDGWPNPGCSKMTEMALDGLAAEERLDGVVLISRWRTDLIPKLLATVEELRAKGLDVVVLGPVPEYQGSLPVILARAINSGNQANIGSFRNEGIPAIDNAMRTSLSNSGARYYSTYQSLCTDSGCELFAADGVPTAFDYGHLTLEGAAMAIENLERP